MESNENRGVSRPFNAKTLVFGLIVIGLGLTWLLKNTGYLSEEVWDVIFSWEMLLISIGVISLFNEKGKFFGIILIAVGGFFLFSHHFELPFNLRKVLWPALLIIFGLYLIFGSRRLFRKRTLSSSSEASDMIDEVSIFGGHEKRFRSENFMGGQVVSIFGGSELDLSQCKLAQNAELEMTSIFGGSKLILPEDWNVQLEVVNVFGGFGDKRRNADTDMSKTLIIKGVSIFGGGEIKSY